MISIELTGAERLQFQYILPIQGSLRTLELVEKILQKCKIESKSDLDKSILIDFEDEEMNLIKDMIDYLDKNNQIKFEALSLVRKLIKGEN